MDSLTFASVKIDWLVLVFFGGFPCNVLSSYLPFLLFIDYLGAFLKGFDNIIENFWSSSSGFVSSLSTC